MREKNTTVVKSLFISDVHIGSKCYSTQGLVEFIKQYQFENLFLVGDILDAWRLRKKWSFKKADRKFINYLFELKNHGINVVYITGNHDDFLRPFTPFTVGGVEICDEYIYKNILITHGDRFDTLIKNQKWLYYCGAIGYHIMININIMVGKIRKRLKLRPWHISKAAKTYIKNKLNYLNNFHFTAKMYAQKKGCNAVICGHTHIPEIKQFGKFIYYNCGDWHEGFTCLIENLDGKIYLHEEKFD